MGFKKNKFTAVLTLCKALRGRHYDNRVRLSASPCSTPYSCKALALELYPTREVFHKW
jgi:hypothetical protein